MKRVRRCDSRCHNAKGTRCGCWCGGALHGAKGLVNREALAALCTKPELQKEFLKQHGFESGKTAYLEQRKLC